MTQHGYRVVKISSSQRGRGRWICLRRRSRRLFVVVEERMFQVAGAAGAVPLERQADSKA